MNTMYFHIGAEGHTEKKPGFPGRVLNMQNAFTSSISSYHNTAVVLVISYSFV